MPPAPLRLTDLCDLVMEQVDPISVPNSLYVGLEHIESGALTRASGGKAAEVRSTKSVFRKNDVLYGKLRPYLDKAIMADADGICSTELLVLRAKPDVDPKYLVALLHAPEFIEYAVAGTAGVQHPRTSWPHIRELVFQVPARNVQEQIASMIWLVHDALQSQKHVIDAGHALKQATLSELFTRGMHGERQKETEIGPIPESWSVVDFGSVRRWLQYGTSVRCSTEPGAFPVLRIPNIEPGRVNAADLKYCNMSVAEADNYRLEHGDLIFIRTNGVLDRLGSCAVYASEPERALFASYLIRARLQVDKVVPRFAAYFFGSEGGTSIVAGRATPAADGKYNLNTGTIDSFPLPLPATLDEQSEIVATIDAIDRKIDLHKRKRDVLDELFRSLLHKLMTGEIRVNDLSIPEITQ